MTEQGKGITGGRCDLILLIAAFAAVYVIWGSTYLAIKYAIDTIPSFLMAGVRFMAAGAVLYVGARLSPNYEKPKAVHWRTAFIVGALLLGIGNGGVVIAEKYISSSLTALLVATTPFWMVLIGWIFMGSGRPNFKVTLGLLVGFIGVALLIVGGGEAAAGTGGSQLFGIFLVIFATLGWAIGSLYGTRGTGRKVDHFGGRNADAGWRFYLDVDEPGRRRMERIQLRRHFVHLVACGCLSDIHRGTRRIHGIQLAAQKCVAVGDLDLCICKPGRRGSARMGDRGRIDDGANAFGCRDHHRLGGAYLIE